MRGLLDIAGHGCRTTPGGPPTCLRPQIKMGQHHVMLKSLLTPSACLFCPERCHVSAHQLLPKQSSGGRRAAPASPVWATGCPQARALWTCPFSGQRLWLRAQTWKRRGVCHSTQRTPLGSAHTGASPAEGRLRTALAVSLRPAEGAAATNFWEEGGEGADIGPLASEVVLK